MALENGKLGTVAPFVGVAPLSGIVDLGVEADAPEPQLAGFEQSGPRPHGAGRVSGAGAQACGRRKAGTLAEVRP